MAEFIADCPRCGAEKITFDCYSSNPVRVEFGWRHILELFTVCRRCHYGSIQLVNQIDSDSLGIALCKETNKLLSYKGALNDVVKFERYVTVRDRHSYAPPDHLPENIARVMTEANSSLAGQCFNAAGAMYRLALDLATKGMLPEEGEPPQRVRRSLGLRLQWLFDNGLLPPDLQSLAECLQQDGNDGVHDGTLSKEDAEDLHDFSFEMLRRIYTEPERVRIAEGRRTARRGGLGA